tara:strand:+ start:260 stop:691 length:432 start_codon:yes stop_codon:yes gene_type:complete
MGLYNANLNGLLKFFTLSKKVFIEDRVLSFRRRNKMLAGWIIIGLLAFLALAVIFKFQDVIFVFALVRKYMFAIVMISLILFLAFSLSHINGSYDVDLTSPKGWSQVGEVYLIWAKAAFGNVGKVTGFVSKQDWSLNNSIGGG